MPGDDQGQKHNTGLSARDLGMLNIVGAAALKRTDDLHAEINKALADGVTADEVREILDHVVLHADTSVADCVRIVEQALTDPGQ